MGKVQRASLRYKDQRSESALDELRDSVAAIPQMGVHTITSYYTSLLARAYQQAGKTEEGLQALDEAQVSIDARGEVWWEAEIQRLRGEILLSQSAENTGDAGACFERALHISRHQEAKSLELRAAMSLARLRRGQGKGDEARRLLGECYAWFTEGFDTADLTEAKALLDEMS
jgi:predicted ATPase